MEVRIAFANITFRSRGGMASTWRFTPGGDELRSLRKPVPFLEQTADNIRPAVPLKLKAGVDK